MKRSVDPLDLRAQRGECFVEGTVTLGHCERAGVSSVGDLENEGGFTARHGLVHTFSAGAARGSNQRDDGEDRERSMHSEWSAMETHRSWLLFERGLVPSETRRLSWRCPPLPFR